MTSESSKADLSSALPGHDGQRTPQRLHVFLVTTLVVFLVGLILFKPPVRGYRITAELGCNPSEIPGRPAPARSSQASEGLSDRPAVSQPGTTASLDSIRRAVRRVSQHIARPSQEASNVSVDEIAEQVQRRLVVRVRTDARNQTHVMLCYRGLHPDWSIALLNELASEFLAPKLPQAAELLSTPEIREARWHVELRNHYQHKAWLALQSLLSKPAGDTSSDVVSDVLSSAAAVDTRASAFPARAVNPEWERLQNRVADLTSQLQVLLQHETPNHPIVHKTTEQIKDIRQRLRRISPYLEPIADENQLPGANAQLADSTEQSPRNQDGAVPAGANQRQAELDAALDECQSTSTARIQAEASLWDLIDRQMATRGLAQPASRWMIAPARITRRLGGAPSPMLILLLGLAALLGGALMAWLSGTLGGLNNMNTIKDVRQSLPVPIVCQLPFNSTGADIQRLIMRGRMVRWATIAGELTLGLLLVTFVVGSLSGTSTLGFFNQDPLGTFTETIVQVWHQTL